MLTGRTGTTTRHAPTTVEADFHERVHTDMYAKAAQGMAPADAVKWAEAELKKIYEG